MSATRAVLCVAACLLLSACGGGDDGGSKDLANGKVFGTAELQKCLRAQGWRIEPRTTDSGIDFTTRSRSGLISADVGVEKTPADAEQREGAWKELAAQAQVDNIEDYYFRYGNVVVGFERVPGKSDRAPIERCLT